MSAEKKPERLFCLDALRGLDMLLLTVIGPFFFALNAACPLPKGFMYQISHHWGVFTLWDIIMPLFIFMCGAAVPFGLGRRLEDGRPGWAYWKHVIARVILLWVLGMMAQGNLFSLDPVKIHPFSNTLQSIAMGYLIASFVWLVKPAWVRRLVPVALALAYGLILHFGGDYSEAGNAAVRFERWFVPLVTPAGSVVLQGPAWRYTWWLTSLMFGAMTLCGMEATLILTGAAAKARKAGTLAGLGAALLAVGWLLVPVVPPIKHIYTVSFTAQAMGWSCLALAALYVLTDILMLRRGWWLVILFGQTALIAYMCIDVFGATFRAFAHQVTQGVPRVCGPVAGSVSAWLVQSALLVFILTLWRTWRRSR